MNIFITGITGFIGRHLCEYWSADHRINLFGCARAITVPEEFPVNVQYTSLDLVDKDGLNVLLDEIKPSVIVHAAAMSRPNDCELDHELCRISNTTATQNVLEAANAIGAKLVFLSTDMVFANNGPYHEEDETCPLNYYGQTKAAAEQLIVQSAQDFAIVRTVLVYGKKLPGLKNSFLQWVMDNILEKRSIRVFTDQYRTITYVNDLCKGIDLVTRSNQQGIFHLCGEEVFTPFQMAVEVVRFHQMDESLVQPITHEDMQEAAVRPSNCTLSVEKAKQQLGYTTTALKTALLEIFG